MGEPIFYSSDFMIVAKWSFKDKKLSARLIAILTVYKQLFWYLNFANHRTKESFVTATNKPLVGTLMTIGDVTVSIAITQASMLFSKKINDNKTWRFDDFVSSVSNE